MTSTVPSKWRVSAATLGYAGMGAGWGGEAAVPALIYQTTYKRRPQNKPLYLQVLPKATSHFWEEYLLPFNDPLLCIWPLCGHLFKFGSKYLGGKFAYWVSHNTVSTHKVYTFTLKTFMFIIDELSLDPIITPTFKPKALQTQVINSSLKQVSRQTGKEHRWLNRLVSVHSQGAGCWALPLDDYTNHKFSLGFNSFTWVIMWHSQGLLFLHLFKQAMLKCDSSPKFLMFTTGGWYDSQASGWLSTAT